MNKPDCCARCAGTGIIKAASLRTGMSGFVAFCGSRGVYCSCGVGRDRKVNDKQLVKLVVSYSGKLIGESSPSAPIEPAVKSAA